MGAERARLPAPAGRKRRTKQPPEHLSGRPAPSPDIVEKASFRTPTKKDDAPRLLRPENDSRHDGPRLGTQRGDAFLRTHNDRKFHRAHSDRREKDAERSSRPGGCPATHETRVLPVFGVQKIEDAPATHEARLCAKERAPSRLFGVRTRPFRPLPGGQTRPQSRTRRARYRAFPAPAADSSNSPVSCRSRPP